jgi:integrase/recombinase XerC/integrase/recombinase XerD
MIATNPNRLVDTEEVGSSILPPPINSEPVSAHSGSNWTPPSGGAALLHSTKEGTKVRRRTPRSTDSRSGLSVADLEACSRDWLLDGELRMLSERTVASRRDRLGKLLWFLRRREAVDVGPAEIRAFLAYLSTGHRDPGGRWGGGGDTQNHQALKPVKPSTVKTYFIDLKSFFNYLVAQEVLDASPMERISPPIDRRDQIQPFTASQVQQLLAAARRSRYRRRDEALILFMVDTGARASEVCGLERRHLDLEGRRCVVEGKGGKARTIYFGRETARALWNMMREHVPGDREAVFVSERGLEEGRPLTRGGLLRVLVRLGKAAGIQGVRCSPHTLRHTFALMFIQAGGSAFALQQALGHDSLAMTRRYCALAEADLAAAAKSFSPADRLLRGKR